MRAVIVSLVYSGLASGGGAVEDALCLIPAGGIPSAHHGCPGEKIAQCLRHGRCVLAWMSRRWRGRWDGTVPGLTDDAGAPALNEFALVGETDIYKITAQGLMFLALWQPFLCDCIPACRYG